VPNFLRGAKGSPPNTPEGETIQDPVSEKRVCQDPGTKLTAISGHQESDPQSAQKSLFSRSKIVGKKGVLVQNVPYLHASFPVLNDDSDCVQEASGERPLHLSSRMSVRMRDRFVREGFFPRLFEVFLPYPPPPPPPPSSPPPPPQKNPLIPPRSIRDVPFPYSFL